MKRLLLATMLFAAGCTTAGPFVTSISSDGNGNLVIEKAYVVHDEFWGIIYNGERTTTTIRVGPERDPRAPRHRTPGRMWTGRDD